MYGLVIKDLLVLRAKFKIFPLILLVLLGGLALYLWKSSGALVVTIFIPIYFCALVIPLFLEDEKVKWNIMALSSPIQVKEIVISRYISSFTILSASILFLLVFNVIYAIFFSALALSVHLLTLLVSFLIGIIYLSVLIPSIYHNGANGSSTVMLIFILVFSAASFGINSGFINPNNYLEFNPIILGSAFIVLLLFISWASFFLSIKIFKKNKYA